MDLEPSVRRCASCGAAALVCVSRYQPGRLSLTGDITDWVCQRCGRPVTLHAVPWLYVPVAGMSLPLLPLGLGTALWAVTEGELLALVIMGGPLLVLPVGLSAAVLWPWWTSRRHPVVPGASRPEMRHRDTQPRRRCACLATARCTKVTASRVNGIYTGTEYDYSCERCGRTFTVESPLSALLTLGASVFLGALTALLWPASLLEAGWGELCVVGLLGGGAALTLAIAVARVLARVRHPVVGLLPG